MGDEKIKLPSTAKAWAIHLSKVVKVFHEIHGLDRFPIDVATIAREYTKNVYPDAPITLVEGRRFSKKFEGALVPNPNKAGEWGILYNSSISSSGRINFTLGHELGHYLLHRHLTGDPIYCVKSDMWKWDSEYGKMEAEANQFASYLLIPLDDFRDQVSGLDKPTVDAFEEIRRRYDVSLTAAILKWLEITPKRAMIVVGRNGFIDWSWSSNPLLKSGVFFKARQNIIPLPDDSLAAGKITAPNAAIGKMFAAGVWSEHEDVFESTIFSEYHDLAISLLLYPNAPPSRTNYLLSKYDDLEPSDTFGHFQRR